ncbi:hypothetical protein FGO68_gene12508 [Halteria grandinella]|uniref:protein-tyrosine-phosphatase n=1 Tax=Halteria grandinella TaxID=5974 RepID=A0A8J8NLH0_HALGN|nr:hypothetical protein FGO68_gene12508 [Halteria grandinella]
MTQIIPYLFLGDMDLAQDKESLSIINCKHILHCTNTFKPCFESDFNYKALSINDMPQENLLLLFDDAIDFIKHAIDSEETIYVHCNAGVSRSASFVIAYFIREHGLTFEEALNFVKAKRGCVFPNYGFQKQLQQYAKTVASSKKGSDSGKGGAGDIASVLPSTAAVDLQAMFSQPPPMTSIEESKEQPAVAEAPKPVEAEAVQKLQYSCKKCRKVLFSEDNLEEHMSKVKAYNTKTHSLREVSQECSSIFLEQMDWIVIEDESEQMGKISCPKCQEKIGKYYIYGAQCSCGRWVAPGYQIHKSKVDEIRPFVL